MKKRIRDDDIKIDDLCEIYETKDINKVEFEMAHNDINKDYVPYICVYPKSYGAESLLFWMDTVMSVKIKAICLAKLFWLLLNDENMARIIFEGGRSQNLQDLKSDCGFDHNSKDGDYCDAVGIKQEDFKKAFSALDNLFYANHMEQMVDILELFLQKSFENKIKSSVLHILLRNLIEKIALA
ncbi:MAG: hypothetical protein US71_C0001G0045 [Parcubacteria group bacterium GW2011_GWD2_38_12]|nr:MAG: hypothetical protein US06_C0001G0044 [Parcubacteria group bacterium GW2011_GWC2_36_17]KKQ39413.1 MAG: hypothetical protein US56_C0018G0005 [Candidatus Moranbacteria bacterium GW2011_GWF2_37_7]KKQ43912.1 MAG: hypothetical protein US61_C0001G0025 [Parcubacteria group bacterium GW2011_GWE2_37_8]KKQ52842.1 MAG: hypothetical protein US71_C0001G0045 [Parcubacteria group bacterium GW2011_GWD2_38_12]KKQ59045.1 MAG: hypothetical protein US79_C0001G0044 [Parcubacteria group bacterium GW2011_GWC1_